MHREVEEQIKSIQEDGSDHHRHHHLQHLAALQPASTTRAWQSCVHPSVPLVATCSTDRCVRIYNLINFRLHSVVEGGHQRSVRSCAWKPEFPSSSPAGHHRHAQKEGNDDDDDDDDDGRGRNETVGGESVLATGSFDASAGIWRRWKEGIIGQSLLSSSSSLSPSSKHRRHRHHHHQHDGQEEEEEQEDEEEGGRSNDDIDDDWRFAVVLQGHDSEIKSVAWSCTGSFLATCSRDKSVWIWEEMSSSSNQSQNHHDDKNIIGGGGGGDDFETVAVLQDHEADVKCVVWHPSDNTLLASSSYDETIRLYREEEEENDWICIAVLRGHTGTVWQIDFEGPKRLLSSSSQRRRRRRRKSGSNGGFGGGEPRLVSCSEDLTIRIWRRLPPRRHQTDNKSGEPQRRYSSSVRPWPHTSDQEGIENDDDDDDDNHHGGWVEESILPRRHDRTIYSVAWSRRSGRIVSTGGDGKIVIYEEKEVDVDEGESRVGIGIGGDGEKKKKERRRSTEWVVLAEKEAAHGVYEINHVCWSKRFDHRDGHHLHRHYQKKEDEKEGGMDMNDGEEKQADNDDDEEDEEEETVLSTGDDGVVNVWRLII